jgi:drug/metabolite transporter (DMT)-like permease
MRIVQIIGVLLIAGGLYILVKSPTYSSEKSLFAVGTVEATMHQSHEIPPWVGCVAAAAGLALIVVGARRRAP